MSTESNSTGIPSQPTSEVEALFSIFEWSKGCPNWQRDALKRLCSQDEFSEIEFDEFIKILKGDLTSFDPIAEGDVRDPSATTNSVAIKHIKNVNHINALANDQVLPFSQTGMTIVYGNNGAGKSGYVKILKSACRARISKSRDENNILPNIYAENRGEQTAEIGFCIGNITTDTIWKHGQASDPALSAVSVFDSRAANVHISAENTVAFNPKPLQVLDKLVQTSKKLKEILDREIKTLEAATPSVIKNPECSPTSEVGKLIAGLKHDTSHDLIDKLAGLTETEVERFNKLKADLSGDPEHAARQLKLKRESLQNIITRFNSLKRAINKENFDRLNILQKEYDIAKEASKLASVELFSKEPLPHIGEEVWRSMWESARKYSDTLAYPSERFPVAHENSYCVLCMQKLSPEAVSRLNSFEKFVKDESKAKEEIAKKALDEHKKLLHSSWISRNERNSIYNSIKNEINDESLVHAVREFLVTHLINIRYIRKNISMPFYASKCDDSIFVLINKQITQLKDRETTILAEKNSPERAKLIAEYNGLKDREWLNVIKNDVKLHLVRLAEIYKLKTISKETETTKITTKSKDVAEALITNRLRAYFAKEISRLGIANLALEMRQDRAAQGKPLFKVALSGSPNSLVDSVLSEGEHRCVALALFLADLCTISSKSSIIFDDPVSSLDHMYIDKVSRRLAEESNERQVIVFTHDLPFLFQLQNACKNVGASVSFCTITRNSDSTGLCDPQAPFYAKSTKDSISTLREELREKRVHYEQGNENKWSRESRNIYNQLRTAWERAVEEALSPVLTRYNREVYTSGLYKINVLTDEDCSIVTSAYANCLPSVHAQPVPLNKPASTPDEIERDISVLETWLNGVLSRQVEKQKERQRINAY